MPLSSLSSSMFLKVINVALATFLATALSFSRNVQADFVKPAVIDAPLLTEKIATNNTILVDINGEGDYRSIQEAIDAVPENNSKWVIIHIRKGVYRFLYTLSCFSF